MNNSAQKKVKPARITPFLVQVKAIKDITPGIRCITFTADALRHYPKNCEGQHLKIFISHSLQAKPTLPVLSKNGPLWPTNEVRSIVRTYTIRAVRPELQEIDIEFAMHDHSAPAINFAKSAQPGNWLGISGPGGDASHLLLAHHIFMAGDPSSLPAITALAEKMHANTQGKIIIRIDKPEHKRAIHLPKGVEIIWVVGDISQTATLIETVKLWSLPTNDVAFWIGGEEQIVKTLRHYLRQEKEYNSTQMYAIPYWRYGYNEENYHNLRHQLMDN